MPCFVYHQRIQKELLQLKPLVKMSQRERERERWVHTSPSEGNHVTDLVVIYVLCVCDQTRINRWFLKILCVVAFFRENRWDRAAIL